MTLTGKEWDDVMEATLARGAAMIAEVRACLDEWQSFMEAHRPDDERQMWEDAIDDLNDSTLPPFDCESGPVGFVDMDSDIGPAVGF